MSSEREYPWPRRTKTSTATPLTSLGVETVILTGIAGNICVLFTANDAYLRDFAPVVPCDCMASKTDEENRHALE
jgi:nicotinamidase-related amidase